MKGNSNGGKVNTEQFYELKLDIAGVKTDVGKDIADLEKNVSALSTNLTSLKENTVIQIGSVKESIVNLDKRIDSFKWSIIAGAALISIATFLGTYFKGCNEEKGPVSNAHASQYQQQTLNYNEMYNKQLDIINRQLVVLEKISGKTEAYKEGVKQ